MSECVCVCVREREREKKERAQVTAQATCITHDQSSFDAYCMRNASAVLVAAVL